MDQIRSLQYVFICMVTFHNIRFDLHCYGTKIQTHTPTHTCSEVLVFFFFILRLSHIMKEEARNESENVPGAK